MRRNRDGGNSKLRIRFFEVSVEGTSETIEEAIRNVANVAMHRSITAPANNIHSLPSSAPAVNNGGQQTLDLEDIQEAAVSEASSNGVPASPSSKPKTKRTYPTPDLLEIDLNGGDMPFETYCQRKSPGDTMKRYLVIAAWLKEYRNTDIITAAHIYTCYRKMGWGVQRDVGQPLRGGKKQGYFRSGAQDGSYELTHIGLDAVRKMGGE
jgi:hypothetical protein